MNKIRELLARAVERNGGYDSVYSNTVSLAWNVKVHSTDFFDMEEVFDQAVEQGDADPDHKRSLSKLEFDLDELGTWALDNVREFAFDDQGLSMMSPDVARRYGLDHSAMYDAEFCFVGRSGGYVGVEKFEGKRLDCRADQLARRLRDNDECQYYGYSNEWCRKLLAMITEWGKCFTPAIAQAEVERTMAFILGNRLEDVAQEYMVPVCP
jgi:hypothetical protein